MNVYQRLNAAREEFHSLKLQKTGHNKFAGYYYFELGDFLIPALRVFKNHGLCAVVSFDSDVAAMVIRNTEKPDDMIQITSPMGSAALKGCHEVQNIGAVETYQRRYLWVAALEIVEHDALDATTGKDKASNVHKPTAGAGDSLDIQRKSEIETLVMDWIEAHRDGRDGAVIESWYAPATFTDNEERVYAWDLLKTESKLRSTIKANKKETA